ncbi:potassium transporter TrkG [Mycoplasma sp. SG1]|uniref:potassium transporter TrkG n=1 Tax=Mycoplasma sp. SG1 TaxID=2810348 RepID=UPI002024068C|nr:potassium transporter TrkG [Mycoplasma sp. SG1]URM53022.1 hypothetical protein JRW51_01605 [Mycoplasma sp. SG1]
MKNFYQKKSNQRFSFFKFYKKLPFKFRLFLGYVIILFVIALLLWSKWALKNPDNQNPLFVDKHQRFSFIDALFNAASAFSDTGLTTTNVWAQFNLFGQFLLMLLIQLGGIGIIVIKFFIIFTIGKKLGFLDKIAFNEEKGFNKLGQTFSITSVSVISIFLFEAVFSLIFMFHFHQMDVGDPKNLAINPNDADWKSFNHVVDQLHNSWTLSWWYGLFHSVSALNNAGFDIFGGNTFVYFGTDYFFQILVIILFVVGGIGFPIFYEFYLRCKYFYQKHFRYRKVDKPHFSLFFKVAVLSYFIVFFAGIFLVLLIEYINSAYHIHQYVDPKVNNSIFDNAVDKNFAPSIFNDPHFSFYQKFMYIVFNASSTRNAGFGTIPIQRFAFSSRVILSFMMWIGSSPCSTGGGIRSTTMFIVILTIIRIIQGKSEKINVFSREVPNETIKQAFIIFVTAIILVFISSIICLFSISNSNLDNVSHYNFLDSFFENTSAFGTTGLSTGFSYYLDSVSKIAIIILMFIGQLTISNVLLVTVTHHKKIISQSTFYPEEDILIG